MCEKVSLLGFLALEWLLVVNDHPDFPVLKYREVQVTQTYTKAMLSLALVMLNFF